MDDVVITMVNYRMKEDTLRCLASLYEDIRGSSVRVRVVVVDNASGDGIGEALAGEFPQVAYYGLLRNHGFGAAQNIAMRCGAGRYYLLLNPDIVFFEGGRTVERLVRWMDAHPKVGIAAPKLLNRDGSVQLSCYRFPRLFAQPARRLGYTAHSRRLQRSVEQFLMADFAHDRTTPVDWLMGSAMIVRAATLLEVGGFDERYFMYFEDCDWCRRFWEAGWPVYYIEDVRLLHMHRRASASIPGLRAVLFNPLTRVHIKSWLKYFIKWGVTTQ